MSTRPNISPQLYLKGQDFHRLSQLETKENTNFIIKIGLKQFNLTKEETFILSLKAYYSIFESSLPFEIPLPVNQDKISNESIIQCFTELIQLFSTKTQIQINYFNVETFKYMNKYLKNLLLKKFV
jgi:hypothetical protein